MAAVDQPSLRTSARPPIGNKAALPPSTPVVSMEILHYSQED